MNWTSTVGRSYLRKALADTRAAALSSVGGIGPDPDGPATTAEQRRERLMRVLGVTDTGQSLADVEALAQAALTDEPAVHEHEVMEALHPAAMLHRADVVGDEARQPSEPVAADPDAPEPAEFPPAEQGDEGP